MTTEPIFDVAHLAHVELLTPKLEESARFFIEVMGMVESGRKGDSVYLRGWDDYEHHTLQLTSSATSGIGHYAVRASSPQALQTGSAIEKSGLGKGWNDKNTGHGPAYCSPTRITTRWKFIMKPVVQAAEGPAPALRNQASRTPNRGIAAAASTTSTCSRRMCAPRSVFLQESLGGRMTEQIIFDDGSEKASWITFTNKTYDVAISEDWTGSKGRLHHITYAVDSREDILRAADICLEYGVFMETGPHKHAIQQTFFLYVYEPGGNRFEIACRRKLILAPDWQPSLGEASRRAGREVADHPSFHTHGTPPVE
jgi:catechol 2,3-dioxygenase